MRVLVNGSEVACSPGEAQTVDGLIQQLKQQGALPDAEAVARIKVDGKPWALGELAEALSQELEEVDRVAIRTLGLRDYAAEILSDSAALLRKLTDQTREVADAFRTQDPEEANARLFRLLDAVHRLVVCLCTVQNACTPDEGAITGHDGPLAAVAGSLEKLELSQQSEDWDGLARNLEQELSPALSGLSGSIETLRRHL